MSGGGGGEVGADDEDRLVGPFGEEARAGESGGLRVAVAERISTMRVIFTPPSCQLSIVLTPPRSRFDPTEFRGPRLRFPSGGRRGG